ncbi:MAG: signal recognition particle protein [Chloroflexi bacterium]|nr:signal recognition particle protein [Chloroflexota bacterium]
MFENLSERLTDIFADLRKRGKLSEADVDAAMREIRLALLEADVHYGVAKSFIKRVKERAVGAEVQRSLTPGQQVVKIVNEELTETLGEPGRLRLTGSKPHVIMLVGLQGSGKTTTAAKLALHLRRDGHTPLLIAADTYRPAAVDQLVALGKQLNIQVHQEGTAVSPPEIAANGVRLAKRENHSVAIVDTAGRLQIDQTMMDEIAAIEAQVTPSEILLVADSMLGQEAVNVAQGFSDAVGITGLVLTKVDGDARGGAAISMREVTGVPIKFLGTSEKMDGLEVFHPKRLSDRILGMGDVLGLIEAAEQMEIDEEEALEMQRKMREASFTLEDFQKQLRMVKKMGPLSQVMEMIPGAGQALSGISSEDMDRELKRVEAIINSMTPDERRNPKLLNASRRKRIAAGSGTQVRDVNDLMKRFREAQKMIKKLSKSRRLPADMGGLFRQ